MNLLSNVVPQRERGTWVGLDRKKAMNRFYRQLQIKPVQLKHVITAFSLHCFNIDWGKKKEKRKKKKNIWFLTILDCMTKSSSLNASSCMVTAPEDKQENACTVFVRKRTGEWEIMGCDSHNRWIYSVNYFFSLKGASNQCWLKYLWM